MMRAQRFLGALMIKGLQPGPLLFQQAPDVVQGIYISVILSYIVIFLFSIVSIKVIARLLNVKTSILSAFVLVFCVIGCYATRGSYFDVFVALAFGLIGYWMRKDGYSLGPMTLALVLGQMIEQKLAGAMKLSGGSIVPFLTRPISLVLLLLTVLVLTLSVMRVVKNRKKYVKND